jgi:hypothetical protein
MCQNGRLYSEWLDHSRPKKRNKHNKYIKHEVPKTAHNINEEEMKNSNAVRECQDMRRPAAICTVP